jgi:Tfp pilus assembly protein PilN
MKPLQLDFAPQGLRRTLHTTPAAWWLLLVAGAVLCVSAGLAFAKLSHQQRQLQTQQRLQDERLARAPVQAAQAAIALTQATAVNSAVMQLNLPWRDLHEAIEQGTPATVALLSLDPDPTARTLRIVAEARSTDAMLGFVEMLKQQPFFTSAVLVKHEVNEQDPNHALRFQVDVQWTSRRMP